MLTTYFILSLLGIWATYLTSLVIYRLCFHPFSRYPGPFLAKVSYFYAFYHALRDDTGIAQQACHEKYGAVVRYNPDALSFDEPAAAKEINAIGKNFFKGKAWQPMNFDPHARPNVAFNPDKKDHARRKRIITQAFSRRALRESEVYAHIHTDKLCSILGDLPKDQDGKWSETTNLRNFFYWVMQDIFTELIFGQSYNLLTDSKFRDVGELADASLWRYQLAFQYPALFRPGAGDWRDLGTWIAPNSVAGLLKFLEKGAMSTMERLTRASGEDSQRKDILSYLISARDPETGTGIEQQDIVSEACILLMSGAGTFATELQILFFYLSRDIYRETYRTLARELRTSFKNADEITIDRVEHLPYLQATCLEGLRFTASYAFWREAGTGGEIVTISDHEVHEAGLNSPKSTKTYHIPAGCAAGANPYCTVRNPNIYPDPYKFAPERHISTSDFYTSRGFDKESASKVYERAKQSLRPFSVGARACIAETLVWAFLPLVVAKIVWEFDVKQAPGEAGELGGGGPGKGWRRGNKEDCQLYGSFSVRVEGPAVQLRRCAGL